MQVGRALRTRVILHCSPIRGGSSRLDSGTDVDSRSHNHTQALLQHTHAHIHVHSHTCTHTRHTYILTHVHTHRHINTHTNIYTYIHTYIHRYTDTHPCTPTTKLVSMFEYTYIHTYVYMVHKEQQLLQDMCTCMLSTHATNRRAGRSGTAGSPNSTVC